MSPRHVAQPRHYGQVKSDPERRKHVHLREAAGDDQAPSPHENGRPSPRCLRQGRGGLLNKIRFYPLSQQAHGAWSLAGDLGDIRFITGHYPQGLAGASTPTRTGACNTRIGGRAPLPSATFGTHWIRPDQLITRAEGRGGDGGTGKFPAPNAKRPTGPVETFSSAAGATENREVDTGRTRDDRAGRYEGGARGVMSHQPESTPAAKNALHWDVAGAKAQRPPGIAKRPTTCSSATATRRTRC